MFDRKQISTGVLFCSYNYTRVCSGVLNETKSTLVLLFCFFYPKMKVACIPWFASGYSCTLEQKCLRMCKQKLQQTSQLIKLKPPTMKEIGIR